MSWQDDMTSVPPAGNDHFRLPTGTSYPRHAKTHDTTLRCHGMESGVSAANSSSWCMLHVPTPMTKKHV